MSPVSGLNATFASNIARPGQCRLHQPERRAVHGDSRLEPAKEMVGFSAFVSVGSMLDVGWGDLIDYLGNDPRTHSIVIYMESIGDARSFLSAAREVALTKPIIVIKAGRTAAAAKAAASHTGSLTGSDEVLDAAFRRSGVLRVTDHRRPVLHGRSAGQAAAPEGPAAGHRDQCGRPGRAGDRRAGLRRRRTGRAFGRDDGGAERVSAAALEPQQSDRHPGRRASPSATPRSLEIAAQDPEQRRPAGDT